MNEVVILVGPQGAGKTHYCRTHLPGHERVSQDEGPRRFESLVRRYEQRLDAGAARVVVDRTNPWRWQRERFAEAARRRGYRVRILLLDVPRDVCERRIADRTGHPTLTPDRMHQALDRFESALEPPTEDECDVLKVVRYGKGTDW